MSEDVQELLKRVEILIHHALLQRDDGVLGDGYEFRTDLAAARGDVAKTDADGRYTLPIDEESIIFVIKPSGYAVPVD